MAKKKIRKVVITLAGPDWRPKIEASLAGPEFSHLKLAFCATREETLLQLKNADAAYVAAFDAGMLKAAPRLKWVHIMRGGVDGLIFPQLVDSSVQVTCLKELFIAPGAEFALMAMLMVQRRMVWTIGRPKLAQSTLPLDMMLKPQDLAGRSVAVLGLGNIGRRIAVLCRAFRMRVLGTARHAPLDGLLDAFYPSAQIPKMLGQADFVVVALPLTPQTKGYLGVETLKAIKPGAWLIDVSGRSAILDYPALRNAIGPAGLGGVVLQPAGGDKKDIPPPEDGLWKMDNVIVSPCRCGSTEQVSQSLATFPENLLRLESGQSLLNLVDKAAGY